jgi:hypothetical protein
MADIVLQLFTTALGAVVGISASYYFFRTQQKTDFNKLRDEVMGFRGDHTQRSSLTESQLIALQSNIIDLTQRSEQMIIKISMIASAVDVKDSASIASSLDALKISYDRLYTETLGLSGKIVDSFKGEQVIFLREVQREFSKSVDRSKADLGVMFKGELAPLIPSVKDQAAVIEHLINLSGHAMMVMGQYHFQAVESQADKAAEKTGKKVEDSLGPFKKEAETVRRGFDELPMLGGPTRR